MKIYVGNISWGTTEEGLKSLFAKFGEVDEANIATEGDTGRSRGFGFVVMPIKEQAENAIMALDGTMFEGRQIKVNESHPKRFDGRGGDRRGHGRFGVGSRDHGRERT